MKRFRITISQQQLPSRDPVARSLAAPHFAAGRIDGKRPSIRGAKHKATATDWEQA